MNICVILDFLILQNKLQKIINIINLAYHNWKPLFNTQSISSVMPYLCNVSQKITQI
jgi:hypothetical protein